jgi:hypothetical protein
VESAEKSPLSNVSADFEQWSHQDAIVPSSSEMPFTAQGLRVFMSPRQLTTVVNTESELILSTVVDDVISFGSTIMVSETVRISERDSLTIYGNGFAIDGNLSVRCLWIHASVVYLNELTVANCYSSSNGGGLLIVHSFLSIARCYVVGNTVSYSSDDDDTYSYPSNDDDTYSYYSFDDNTYSYPSNDDDTYSYYSYDDNTYSYSSNDDDTYSYFSSDDADTWRRLSNDDDDTGLLLFQCGGGLFALNSYLMLTQSNITNNRAVQMF